MFSKRYLCYFLLVVACLVVFSQAELVRAQTPGILGIPNLRGEFKAPQVGTYVKYKLHDTSTKNESLYKLSVVGKETLGKEGDFYWYEIEQNDPKTGNSTIVKMLISGDPQGRSITKRMIFKSGKEPASELPSALVNLMNPTTPETAKAIKPKPKKLGAEKVKTKMKTFDCIHTQNISEDKQVQDIWISAEVPMFGMVKSTSGTTTLELLEHGTGAVTAIKEQAKLLDMPEGK